MQINSTKIKLLLIITYLIRSKDFFYFTNVHLEICFLKYDLQIQILSKEKWVLSLKMVPKWFIK